jgi:hypothetical protein
MNKIGVIYLFFIIRIINIYKLYNKYIRLVYFIKKKKYFSISINFFVEIIDNLIS